MFNTRLTFAIVFVSLLTGCSSMPTEIALGSKVYSAQNAGLVVGALIEGGPYGTWLEFREINTDKNYGWGAKDYYSAWLPAGEYEVQALGSRRGVMGPYSSPLRFNVKQGEINYLGEMVYDCQSPARPTALYGVQSCGFLAMGKCSVPHPTAGVCVVNRQEQTIRTFLKKHPDHADMPVRSSVMSMHVER